MDKFNLLDLLIPKVTPALSDQRSKEDVTGSSTERQTMISDYQNSTSIKPLNVSTTNIGLSQASATNTPLLPIDGMPPFIQKFITTCSDTFRTHRDYWAGSALMATALGIGDKIQLKGNYNNVPIFWMNIIGEVSVGKTEAQTFCLKPFQNLDNTAYKAWEKEYKAYSAKPEKERKFEQEPGCFQYMVNDATPEALTKIHSINTRGLLIFRDELIGYIDDFGRYSKSGEQANIISSWSGVSMTTNRKGGGINSVMRISDPRIMLMGGMQPDIIPSLAAEKRKEDGFLSRFCNVWPDQTEKPRYSKDRVPEELIKQWDEYLIGLTRIPQVEKIVLSVDAENLYETWYNKNAGITSNEKLGYLRGVYGKLDIISLRLAIVIYGMDLLNGGKCPKQVSKEQMQAALNITEYFRATALKVSNKLFNDHCYDLNVKDMIMYLQKNGNSQTLISQVMKVSQPYVSKVLKEVIEQNRLNN